MVTKKKKLGLMDLENVVVGTAKELWAVLDGDSKSHLLFPEKNSGALRLGSEQETRVLLYQRLESSGINYSVETNCRHLYSKAVHVSRQNQDGSGTAHIDVSVYHDRTVESRFANFEIKAGVPNRPTTTWDLLKLVREFGNGVWIVVLPDNLSTTRFARFLVNVKDALKVLSAEFQLHNKLSFALLFMHRRIVSIASVDNFVEAINLFDPNLFEDKTHPAEPWRSVGHATKRLLFQGSLQGSSRIGRKLPAERVSFVYAPSVELDTWLVMSTDVHNGFTRYALRHFGQGNRSETSLKPKKRASNIDLFRRNYVQHELAAGETGEQLPPLKDRDYWRSRLRELNNL